MKFYGLHWTSDDGTEIQIRLAMDTQEMWARSCPRGGEWEAWRRLDVRRDVNDVLLETVYNSIHANKADSADHAAEADTAKKAVHADNAAHAANADNADKAANADNARHADTANNAKNADTASNAKKLANAVNIILNGAVTGKGLFDGANDVTIATSMGSVFTDLLNRVNQLEQKINGVNSRLDNFAGELGNHAAKLAALENRLGSLENKDTTGAITLETLNWRTNCLQQRLTTAPNHFAGFPDWWGDKTCPDYLLQEEPEQKN